MSTTTDTPKAAGKPVVLATYECDEGTRQLVGQRVDDVPRITDRPVGPGRSYLVEETSRRWPSSKRSSTTTSPRPSGSATSRCRAGSKLDVKLDEENVYAPDLLWYADGHGPAEDRPRPHPVPDLAVEVRSPSTWRYDIGVKKQVYETRGLAELWLADPAARTVLVYRRSAPAAGTFDVALEPGPGESLSSPLLPGFKHDLFHR